MQNSIQKNILNVPFTASNKLGIEQTQNFFELFRNIFVEHKDYYKFIAEFDTVYLKNIKNKDYSLGLDAFYDLFTKAYETGLQDKSVKETSDIKLYYYTCTHSLLELCKKLASTDSNLKQDNEVSKIKEIEYLISLFISVLKA